VRDNERLETTRTTTKIEAWDRKRSVDTPRSKVQYMKLISKLSLA
jgi:hypothetical protein